MPVIEREFSVDAPIERTWSLLNDLPALGKCIPGVEEVSVLSEKESKWKVKLNVGIVSRHIEALAHVVEEEPSKRLALELKSVADDFRARLTLDLEEVPSSRTKVRFVANVDAKGPFQMIVNQIIKSQLDKMVAEFAANVSAYFHPV